MRETVCAVNIVLERGPRCESREGGIRISYCLIYTVNLDRQDF